MYLKRIETLGFKSFADKTIINFNPGVTGVVGPNGSGKSNVVDAVRWVLGEQSVKQLRGGTTMTDVIFSGSKSRNPHSYAYVTLVLDNVDRYINLDYNEIEVTRKVYRTGESEYFLNKTKCRLKDITDVIIDTGLGKESFNIISQDKVQSLLNSKPEDRRFIFEEAAGVLKYRKRKESATRKLETTDGNLNRVNDILGELENQVEPLRIQSEKAVKFLEMRQELESVEIALLAHEIYELNDELQQLNTQKQILDDHVIALNNEEFKLEGAISELKNRLKDEASDIENETNELTLLVQKLNDVKSEKKLFDERLKYSNIDNKLLENKRNLQNMELTLLEKISQTKNQLSNVEVAKNNAELLFDKNNKIFNELTNKRQQLRIEYSKTEQDILDVDSKIRAFESNNNSNLFSGVAAVISNPKLTGIIDIVANVVEVSNEYAKAIDYALGANSQFIICESKNDAKNAIEYLNQFKRGRATFMPLDNINFNESKENFEAESGILGFASDLISYDEKYKAVIKSLLGNIVIAKDLDSANKFFAKKKHYRIITLNGEIINPRGSITGGNNNRNNGVFSARHEYEGSKSKLKILNSKLNDIKTTSANLENEISQASDLVHKSKINLMQEKENYSIKSDTLSTYEKEYAEIKSELSNLTSIETSKEDEEEARIIEEIKTLQDKITNKTTKIDKMKLTRANDMVNLEELEAEYKFTSSKLRDDKKQLTEIEIKCGRIDVKLENNLLRLNEEYSLTYEKAFEDYHLNIEFEDARAKVKSLKSRINALGFVNVSAIEEYKVVKERYDFLSTQREDILMAKEELLATIAELDITMKEQFFTTFTEVSQQFSLMFKDLFGGGNASLTLTDPDNLLTTGIEINAQPPGKKLQHLSLLSGGEKALSTLVLLFAILKVRPIPFCILDEVEAALDEANLARFAHFLEGFSANIQFIIITHRKVTMENADILYGVTMQESGVSKLVNVKLKEAEHLVEGVS